MKIVIELNFTLPLEHVTELIVLGEKITMVAIEKFAFVGKISEMDIVCLQEAINRIRLLKYRYRCSFSSHFVPTLDNDTFAIINTKPSNMQGQRWIMIAKFSPNFVFYRLSWS